MSLGGGQGRVGPPVGCIRGLGPFVGSHRLRAVSSPRHGSSGCYASPGTYGAQSLVRAWVAWCWLHPWAVGHSLSGPDLPSRVGQSWQWGGRRSTLCPQHCCLPCSYIIRQASLVELSGLSGRAPWVGCAGLWLRRMPRVVVRTSALKSQCRKNTNYHTSLGRLMSSLQRPDCLPRCGMLRFW